MTIRLLFILLCWTTVGMAQIPLKFNEFYKGLDLNNPILFMRVENYVFQDQRNKTIIFAKEYTLDIMEKHIEIMEYAHDGRNISINIKKYKENGCQIEETLNNEEVYYEWRFLYNTQNCLLEEVCDCNFEPFINREFAYNKGQLIEETETQNQKTVERTCYTYYENGKIKVKEIFDFYANRTVYMYDEEGREIEIIQYKEGNVVRGHIYKEYEGDLMIKEKTLDDQKIYKYDENNHIIEVEESDKDGLVSVVNYTYQYDKRGNWITCLEMRDGNLISFVERKIAYAK